MDRWEALLEKEKNTQKHEEYSVHVEWTVDILFASPDLLSS